MSNSIKLAQAERRMNVQIARADSHCIECSQCHNCGGCIWNGMKDAARNEYMQQRSIVFRSSRQWRNCRNAIVERDCCFDMFEAIINRRLVKTNCPVVHHIYACSDEEGWERRLDWDNLITLSIQSHSQVEQLYKTGCVDSLRNELTYAAKHSREIIRGLINSGTSVEYDSEKHQFDDDNDFGQMTIYDIGCDAYDYEGVR